jgi:hypothetical protein
MGPASPSPGNHEKSRCRKEEAVSRERFGRIGVKNDLVKGDTQSGGEVPFVGAELRLDEEIGRAHV